MAQDNIMFNEFDEGSYYTADLYFMLASYYEYDVLTIIIIWMLIKYYHTKKVTMNMLLDIMI